MAGAFVEAADYVNAMRHRARLVAELAEVMRDVDVLVFPTARGTAEPLGEDSMAGPPTRQPFFNRAFNVTGGPAVSICDGFSRAGLPLSLQIAGRPFEDHLVLKVGDFLERELGTRATRPVLSDAIAAAAE
jgi:aspartyl-tRNA(Asn)/glutamyl-tRNA(Gln) amidotransferase subunit A